MKNNSHKKLEKKFVMKLIEDTRKNKLIWYDTFSYSDAREISEFTTFNFVFSSTSYHKFNWSASYICITKKFIVLIASETFINNEKEIDELNIYMTPDKTSNSKLLDVPYDLIHDLYQLVQSKNTRNYVLEDIMKDYISGD